MVTVWVATSIFELQCSILEYIFYRPLAFLTNADFECAYAWKKDVWRYRMCSTNAHNSHDYLWLAEYLSIYEMIFTFDEGTTRVSMIMFSAVFRRIN